jgi:hypothetical protein
MAFTVYIGSVPDPGSDQFHISERLVRILWVKNTSLPSLLILKN